MTINQQCLKKWFKLKAQAVSKTDSEFLYRFGGYPNQME